MDMWTVEKLEALSYNEIRALAKENSVKAVGKKVQLVEELAKLLIASPPARNDVDEDMDVDSNETFVVEGDSIANSTFIVPDQEACAPSDSYMTADETILSGNISGKIISKNNMDITEDLDENETLQPQTSNIELCERPSRSRQPRHGINSGKCLVDLNDCSGRFNEAHEKLFGNMEDIGEAQKRLEERHAQHMSSVPASRLATPKRSVPATRRFNTPSAPDTSRFGFGSVPPEKISSVQRNIKEVTNAQKPARRLVPTRPPKQDAKALTMRTPKQQQAVQTRIPRRIEELAKPKGAGQGVSEDRRSYTPNTTPFKYVDTTKMSDAEFRAYQREQKTEAKRRQLQSQNKKIVL